MQSYLKYKEYYDRKAKAAPLSEKDFCFILQPKADNQGSKIPFRDYRWIGPYVIEKVLHNDNYIVRRLNTNKTQILHRIRLKKFVPNTPLEDKYFKEKLQSDDEIVIPQDDLYTISWEADFDYQVFEQRRDDNQITTNTDDVINDNADDDARRTRPATSREATITREQIDVTDSQARDEQQYETERPSTATSRDRQNLNETPNHSENDDVMSEITDIQISPNTAEDITVPGISKDELDENKNETSSPRGGKNNLRPNPTLNYTDEY